MGKQIDPALLACGGVSGRRGIEDVRGKRAQVGKFNLIVFYGLFLV